MSRTTEPRTKFGAVVVAVGVTALGAGISLASQTRAFLLQKHVPRWAIGQGFAASAVLLYGADAVSLISFGALNEALGAAGTVALAGGLMLVSLVVAIGAGRAVNTALTARQNAPSTGG